MIHSPALFETRSLRWLTLATTLLAAGCGGSSGSQATPNAPGAGATATGAGGGAAPGTGTAGGTAGGGTGTGTTGGGTATGTAGGTADGGTTVATADGGTTVATADGGTTVATADGGTTGGTAPDGGTPPPATTLAVTGTVLDESGRPVPGAAVQVSGQPPTVTDGSGRFTAAGVTPPYDVSAVFSRSAFESYATVVQGLTRADPAVKVSYDPTTAWPRAWLAGTASTAAGPATPDSVRTVVLLSSPDARRYGWADPTTGAYATGAMLDPGLYVGLPGPETGALYALQATVDARGEPTTYSWFGATSGVSLSPGAQVVGQNVALSTPVQNGNLSGSLSVAGLGSATASLSLSLPGEAPGWMLWRRDLAGPFSVFDIPTPTLAGASFDVTFTAYDLGLNRTTATLRGLAPSAAGLAPVLRQPPALSLPANFATGLGYADAFSWTPLDGGVHRIRFSGGVLPYLRLEVITAATSITLPDLRPLGLALDPAQTYHWQVFATAPASPDEAAVAKPALARAEWSGESTVREFDFAGF